MSQARLEDGVTMMDLLPADREATIARLVESRIRGEEGVLDLERAMILTKNKRHALGQKIKQSLKVDPKMEVVFSPSIEVSLAAQMYWPKQGLAEERRERDEREREPVPVIEAQKVSRIRRWGQKTRHLFTAWVEAPFERHPVVGAVVNITGTTLATLYLASVIGGPASMLVAGFTVHLTKVVVASAVRGLTPEATVYEITAFVVSTGLSEYMGGSLVGQIKGALVGQVVNGMLKGYIMGVQQNEGRLHQPVPRVLMTLPENEALSEREACSWYSQNQTAVKVALAAAALGGALTTALITGVNLEAFSGLFKVVGKQLSYATSVTSTLPDKLWIFFRRDKAFQMIFTGVSAAAFSVPVGWLTNRVHTRYKDFLEDRKFSRESWLSETAIRRLKLHFFESTLLKLNTYYFMVRLGQVVDVTANVLGAAAVQGAARYGVQKAVSYNSWSEVRHDFQAQTQRAEAWVRHHVAEMAEQAYALDFEKIRVDFWDERGQWNVIPKVAYKNMDFRAVNPRSGLDSKMTQLHDLLKKPTFQAEYAKLVQELGLDGPEKAFTAAEVQTEKEAAKALPEQVRAEHAKENRIRLEDFPVLSDSAAEQERSEGLKRLFERSHAGDRLVETLGKLHELEQAQERRYREELYHMKEAFKFTKKQSLQKLAEQKQQALQAENREKRAAIVEAHKRTVAAEQEWERKNVEGQAKVRVDNAERRAAEKWKRSQEERRFQVMDSLNQEITSAEQRAKAKSEFRLEQKERRDSADLAQGRYERSENLIKEFQRRTRQEVMVDQKNIVESQVWLTQEMVEAVEGYKNSNLYTVANTFDDMAGGRARALGYLAAKHVVLGQLSPDLLNIATYAERAKLAVDTGELLSRSAHAAYDNSEWAAELDDFAYDAKGRMNSRILLWGEMERLEMKYAGWDTNPLGDVFTASGRNPFATTAERVTAAGNIILGDSATGAVKDWGERFVQSFINQG